MKPKLLRKLHKRDRQLAKLLHKSLTGLTNAREERKIDKLTDYLDDHPKEREFSRIWYAGNRLWYKTNE